MILLSKIQEASKRLKDIVGHTQLAYAPVLSKQYNANIYLKKENLQLTGSFKIRGAYNKIASLSSTERSNGIIAASAGNHAAGVAFSANKFNIPATIVMPESTPLTKIRGVKEYGVDVVLFGNNYDEAYAKAIELSKSQNKIFVHPFADEEVIAGQGTIALEILEDKIIDTIIVPVGGGGLISGIASAVKQINPNIKVIGVTSKGASAMYQSYHRKTVIDTTSVKTIADGIAVRDTNTKTLEHILELVDEIVEVNDDEIASSILFLMEHQKLVVEGAGAVAVASILHNKIKNIKNRNIVLLLSGGNIDVTMLSLIIEKGLLKSSRKMKFSVTLMDKPGSLMRLTQILSETGANIVQIDYDRTSIDLEYGSANVIMSIETKGEEHKLVVKNHLTNENYNIVELF